MQVPYLQMSSTLGQIGLQPNRPQMRIEQPKADLSITQNHSTMSISTKAGQLFIDQTEAFADAHLKGPLRSSNEFIAKTKGKVAQYIAKTAQQGDMMMRIENGYGAIPRIAAANSELYPERGLNLGVMPRPFSVKFHYEKGDVNVHVSDNSFNVRVQKNDPRISIPKWQSNAYVKQKNNLTIQVVGLNVNRQM